MKKLLFLFLALFLFIPATQAQPRLRIENALNTAFQQAAPNQLYRFVSKQLTDYYGRTDFNDTERQTGWYRVDDFLQWLQNNEEKLAAQEVPINNEEIAVSVISSKYAALPKEVKTAFWVYLGSRYIADRYNIKADFSKFSIILCNGSNCSFGGTGALFISPDSKDAVPSLINLGMHETTHILPDLTGRKTPPLSELATFYSQFNYGLPVKTADAHSLADGIRDFRLTYHRTGYQHPLEIEYNLFVAGLVINNEISPEQILELTSSKTGSDNIPFWLAAIGYVLADRGQYLTSRSKTKSSVSLGNPQEALASYEAEWNLPKGTAEKVLKSPHNFLYLGSVKSSLLSSYLAQKGKMTHLFADKFTHDGEEIVSLKSGYFPISAKEYVASLFPSYKVNGKLETFYRAMAQALPDYVKQDIYAQYPVLSYDMYSNDKLTQKELRELSVKYNKEFISAALQALHYLNAGRPVPLPQGYF